MAKVLISDQYLNDIADAIRNKNGTQNTYTPAQMPNAILTIPTSSGSGTLQIKSNIDPLTTSQLIRPDEGYDGLSAVEINAMPTGTAGTPVANSGEVVNHSITITPTVTNTTGYIVGNTLTGTPVTIDVTQLATEMRTITANGIFRVAECNSVEVNIPTYTLLASAEYEISYDSTTAASHATINISKTQITSDHIIYVKIRDKAGPRAGYFLGSDTFIFCSNKANGSSSSQTTMARVTQRYTTSNTYAQTTTNTGYGVYPSNLNSNTGALTIYKRYNSSNSLIINGTYVVEVYTLDYAPNQGNPYDYTYTS